MLRSAFLGGLGLAVAGLGVACSDDAGTDPASAVASGATATSGSGGATTATTAATGGGSASSTGSAGGSGAAAPFASDDFAAYADTAAVLASARDAGGPADATFQYFGQGSGTVTLENGSTPSGSNKFLRVTYDTRTGDTCGQDAIAGTALNLRADTLGTGSELWVEVTLRWSTGFLYDNNCFNEQKIVLPTSESTRLSSYFGLNACWTYPNAPDVYCGLYDDLGWTPWDAVEWKRVRFHYSINNGGGADVWQMWADDHDDDWHVIFDVGGFDYGGETIGELKFVDYLNERHTMPVSTDVAQVTMWDQDPGWGL